MQSIRLVGNNVFIKLDDESKDAGSIFVPEAHRPTQKTGTVLGVGPGLERKVKGRSDLWHSKRIPMQVKTGDRVIVEYCKGVEFVSGDRSVNNRYRIVDINEVEAVING